MDELARMESRLTRPLHGRFIGLRPDVDKANTATTATTSTTSDSGWFEADMER
jgi:hypothetical protein